MDIGEETLAYAVADFSAVNAAFVECLLEQTGSMESIVLDLGTGPGDIPIRIIRVRPLWHVVAVDGSEAMLRIARAAADRAGVAKNIEWALVDAKHTGLAPHRFDNRARINPLVNVQRDSRHLEGRMLRLARPHELRIKVRVVGVVFLRGIAVGFRRE